MKDQTKLEKLQHEDVRQIINEAKIMKDQTTSGLSILDFLEIFEIAATKNNNVERWKTILKAKIHIEKEMSINP